MLAGEHLGAEDRDACRFSVTGRKHTRGSGTFSGRGRVLDTPAATDDGVVVPVDPDGAYALVSPRFRRTRAREVSCAHL